jgi:RNA polymerase sigma factor (sigma-70 family)
MNENEQVIEHKYLVDIIAGQFSKKTPSNISYEDLHSIGMYGLLMALRKCNDTTTFKRYAEFKIKGAILDYMRELDHLSRIHREEIRSNDGELFVLSLDSTCEWDDEDLFTVTINDVQRLEAAEVLEECKSFMYPSDSSLITDLYSKGLSMTEIAEDRKITWSGLFYKKEKALKQLSNLLKFKRIEHGDLL